MLTPEPSAQAGGFTLGCQVEQEGEGFFISFIMTSFVAGFHLNKGDFGLSDAFVLQVYRQDCETFGMVVKMLVAKDPNLEKQLQVPLRENLGEIRERCLEDLKHFISELDEAVRQPEPSVCDSTTSSTGVKLSKAGVNHSSSY